MNIHVDVYIINICIFTYIYIYIKNKSLFTYHYIHIIVYIAVYTYHSLYMYSIIVATLDYQRVSQCHIPICSIRFLLVKFPSESR